MKFIHFAGISIIAHSLILLLMVLRVQFAFINTNDNSFVQISDNQPAHESKPYKPFVMNSDDSGMQKKKPVIITNQQELQKDDDEPSSGNNYGNYVPFYLVEELPQPVTPINPKYPEEARRIGVEGRVMLLIYIDENGNVKKVEVQKSPNEILSDSALKAVNAVKFKPAKIGGIARAVCMQLTLRFHLE